MNEILKDAPCLCKDDDMEIVPLRRNFFQKLCCYWFQNRDKQYDYPVLYSDGTISKAKCECIGGKPLGVIFENHLITLYDAPKEMIWEKAMGYCKNIEILGYKCEAGKIDFWNKFFDGEQLAVNNILISLKGSPIKYTTLYWTSYDGGASICGFFIGSFNGVINHYRKEFLGKFAVRPVLDLSKVSL